MLKVYFSLFVGVVCVSLASIFIKLIGDVPSVVITTYRLVISSIILIAYSLFNGKKIILNNYNVLSFTALSGLFLSAHFIFWIASIQYTSIPSSVTLVSTSPIFVGIFSYFILKEKQNTIIVISIIISVLGSFILTLSDSGMFFNVTNSKAMVGDIFALIGAVAVSGYFIIGSYLRRNMDIMQYITLVYSFAAIFSLCFSLVLGERFAGYSTGSYFYMVLLAVVPQLLGHTSFNWALKYAKASVIAIATLGEPIGASLFAYIIFKEGITVIQGIGMAIILTSIFIASVKGGKEMDVEITEF